MFARLLEKESEEGEKGSPYLVLVSDMVAGNLMVRTGVCEFVHLSRGFGLELLSLAWLFVPVEGLLGLVGPWRQDGLGTRVDADDATEEGLEDLENRIATAAAQAEQFSRWEELDAPDESGLGAEDGIAAFFERHKGRVISLEELCALNVMCETVDENDNGDDVPIWWEESDGPLPKYEEVGDTGACPTRWELATLDWN